MELRVGDKVRFQFDRGGGVQERIIGLANGRYYAFDTELMLACQVTDTLDEMLEKYKHFKNFEIIKKEKKGDV